MAGVAVVTAEREEEIDSAAGTVAVERGELQREGMDDVNSKFDSEEINPAADTVVVERGVLIGDESRLPGADRAGLLGADSENFIADTAAAAMDVADSKFDGKHCAPHVMPCTDEFTGDEPRLPGADRVTVDSSILLPGNSNASMVLEPAAIGARPVHESHRRMLGAVRVTVGSNILLPGDSSNQNAMEFRSLPCTELRLGLNPSAVDFRPRHLLNPGAMEFRPRPRLNPGAMEFRPRAQGSYVEHAPWPVDPPAYSLNPFTNLNFRPVGEGARNLFDAEPQRQVRAVWRGNWATEIAYLSYLLNSGRTVIIGFDTEYVAPAPAMNQTGPPQSGAEWYHRLQSLVNDGEVVQLAFVLHFEDNIQNPVHIFEINLFFDQSLRKYNPSTLKFLEDSGHVLQEHARHGVIPSLVAEWVRGNIGQLRPATFVFFQGDYDVAFLLRCFALTNYQLPLDRGDFLQTLRATLPLFYDVRILALKLLKRDPQGLSLSSLGSSLGINRLGQSHGSGSDALLTLDCFIHIRRSMGDAIHPLRGVLCGLYATEDVVSLAQPIQDDSINLVDVWHTNFNESCSHVLRSVQNNYSIITISAEFVSELHSEETDEEYSNFRNHVSRVITARFTIAFTNTDGQMAGGRISIFNVCFATRKMKTDSAYIPSEKFSDQVLHHLLSKRGLTWVTYQGSDLIGCIFRCMRPLPPSADAYIRSRFELFPCLYDIAHLTEPRNSTLHKICEACSVRFEKKNGENEEEAVLIARCFINIMASRDPADLEKDAGFLLQKQECSSSSDAPLRLSAADDLQDREEDGAQKVEM